MQIFSVAGDRVTILLVGDETNGAYTIMESLVPPGADRHHTFITGRTKVFWHNWRQVSITSPKKRTLPTRANAAKEGSMRTWAILMVALGLQISSRASEENVRTFRPIDPNQLEAKVPRGFGKIFVEAGRANNLDPLILAAISAHESGGWKSRVARVKKNWMGLMARSGPKRFSSPEASIFYAAALLNRRPFKGHSTLASIAPIYCASNPANWRKSVHLWSMRLMPR